MKIPVQQVHLGLDDVDSRSGGCTTYVAALIVEDLLKRRAVFTDYPNLIRLNPNIPWKTKGNAAVALRFRAEDHYKVFDRICRIVSENSQKEGSDPGVAMLVSQNVPYELKEYSEEALRSIVHLKSAIELSSRYRIKTFTLGSGRGIIGATAAIGNTLEGDHTYELLAYRRRSMWGKPRAVEKASVIAMDEATRPLTFNNFDEEKGRVLITPRGPDPVLLGIRGEDPETLLKALRILKIREDVDRSIIFRTNQGTAAHLNAKLDGGRLKAYSAGYIEGIVTKRPHIELGGHVFFTTKTGEHDIVCAVYEPSGSFRKTALSLVVGDSVEVGGGVRRRTVKHPMVLNVEYIRAIDLAQDMVLVNPKCRMCGKRMKSKGRGQGFWCSKCGWKDKDGKKDVLIRRRNIRSDTYIPPPRAQRHLTRPYRRIGVDNTGKPTKLVKEWYFVQ